MKPSGSAPIAVSYATIDSPIGPLRLAAADQGLIRVAFESSTTEEVQSGLVAELGDVVFVTDNRLDRPKEQLDQYLRHQRTEFDLELDLRLARGFRREVLMHLQSVPFGHTQSYGRLAADLGYPGAARAVGTACAKNPLALVIPCHRVVRADGSIGEYGGGVATKESLLAMEAS
ncbi:MAG: methylated-DNA--[protein]-cysteine S-methyltransferase [Actinobacteria bacterium]|nr:methylated-DNA--[protein]-cysteine S-methyltransferase [Actinomycetota bacterium]